MCAVTDTHATAFMWRSEDNLWEFVLSYYIGSGSNLGHNSRQQVNLIVGTKLVA